MLVSIPQYLAILLGSIASTFALTPMMRNLALKLNWVDRPDLQRKDQTTAIPYMGGVGVIITFTTALIGGLIFSNYDSQATISIMGILLPAIFTGLVGLVDDVKNLSAKSRLVVQTLSGFITALVLVATGTASYLSKIPVLDILLVIVWIVVVTNSLNLLDNMDGLTSSVGGIAGLFYFLIAVVNGQYFVSAMALVLAGGLFGFIYWNKSPAQIYLGDAGALFIGFVLAAISIRINLVEMASALALITPILVLAVPLLDTAVVIFTRLRRGISIFEGGRDHLSHRLVRTGLTKEASVIRLAVMSGISGLLAFLASISPVSISISLIIGLLIALLGYFNWFIKIPDTD